MERGSPLASGAGRSPGRLGRRMLQIRWVRSTSSVAESNGCHLLVLLLALPLLIKHLPDFADAGGILRLLVPGSKGDDPWESKRKSQLIVDLARGVTRAWSDLVSQNLHYNLRLQPHVGDQDGIHSSRLIADFETV